MNIYQVRTRYGPHAPYVLTALGKISQLPRDPYQWRSYRILEELPSEREFQHILHSFFSDTVDAHVKEATRILLQLHGEMEEWLEHVPDRLHGPAEDEARFIKEAIEDTLEAIYPIVLMEIQTKVSCIPPPESLTDFHSEPDRRRIPTRLVRHRAALARLEAISEMVDLRIPLSIQSIRRYPERYLTH